MKIPCLNNIVQPGNSYVDNFKDLLLYYFARMQKKNDLMMKFILFLEVSWRTQNTTTITVVKSGVSSACSALYKM